MPQLLVAKLEMSCFERQTQGETKKHQKQQDVGPS